MPEIVVAGEHRPDVGVSRVAPRLVEPCIDPELVGAIRNGVEVPRVLTGSDVPCTHPTGHGFLRDAAVGDLRPVDDLVADDDRRGEDAPEHGV